MQFRPAFAVDEITHHDERPREQEHECGDCGHEGEGLHDAVGHVQEGHTAQQNDARQEQGILRHTASGELAEDRVGLPVVSQSVEHPGGRVQTGVVRGGGSGEQDEVHDASSSGEPRHAEDSDEGADARHDAAPRNHTHDGSQGQHVEQGQPNRDGVDGLRQCRGGILRLGGSSTDKFDPHEGEEGDLEAGEESVDPVGEESAVIPQVGNRCHLTTGRDELRGDQPDGHQQQDGDGHQLDEGEPELGLTEELHSNDVEQQQDEHEDGCRDPSGDVGPPVLGISGDGGHVTHGCDDP